MRKEMDAGLTLQTCGNPDELGRLVERNLAVWQQREPARKAALAHGQQSTIIQTIRVPFMAPEALRRGLPAEGPARRLKP